MQLSKEKFEQHRQEIAGLYQDELNDGIAGLIFFGIISGNELLAVASLKNYMGTWYLRGCVVKPQHRGQGFQRELIQERIDYLAGRTRKVRTSVEPDNYHSIRNIESAGFVFEKRKTLKDGRVVLVYEKEL